MRVAQTETAESDPKGPLPTARAAVGAAIRRIAVVVLKVGINRAPADTQDLRSAGFVALALNRAPDQFVHYVGHRDAHSNDERTLRAGGSSVFRP